MSASKPNTVTELRERQKAARHDHLAAYRPRFCQTCERPGALVRGECESCREARGQTERGSDE